MSRLLIALSLVTALSATALGGGFAQPPPSDPPGSEVREPAPRFPPREIADRATVRAKLIARRAANLARFRAYRLRGSFPSNVYAGRQLNVWRDQQGRFCAAATIIRASGHATLVDQVAADDNFIRLADVREGALMDWILTSGLTQAELVLIQRPFSPVTRHPELAPTEELLVDATLRRREDARLVRLYARIEATLVKQQARSLDVAVDRLMKHPALAQALVDG